MKKLCAASFVTLMPLTYADAKEDSLNLIVRDKSSFDLLREMTYVIDTSIIRYAVQTTIDDARIDYLRDSGDPNYLIAKFQLDSQRSYEFGTDLMSEISAGMISNEVIQRAVRETWDIISTSTNCGTASVCKADKNVNTRIDQLMQELFPELIEPDAGYSNDTHSMSVNDPVYDSVKTSVISEVKSFCAVGSQLSGIDQAFSLTDNGNVKVELGRLECAWEFINHAFCGARACEVREYAVEGSDIRLMRSYLE
jgi:hypothetical protein